MKPLLNNFIKCRRGTNIIINFEKLVSYLNGRPSLPMRFVYDEDRDLGHNVTVYANQDSQNIVCWNNSEGFKFILSNKDYSRLPKNENNIIDPEAIHKMWEDLDATCDDTEDDDELGYKSWRLWDGDFVGRHQILFCNRDYSYIEGERCYLKKGTAILSTINKDGKVNAIIQMASKEDRSNGYSKYRPIMAGLGKNLGFSHSADLTNIKKLVLTEGILDCYRMNDDLSDGEVAACINGSVITNNIADQLVELCLEHPELERIFMYIESDIATDKHMRNIKSQWKSIQNRVFDKTQHAPGISFIRYENIGLMKDLNKGSKYNADELLEKYDYLVSTNPDILNDNKLTQIDRFDADDIHTLRSRGLEDAFMITECSSGIPEMHRGRGIHIAGGTGDGKTQTALKLLPDLANTTDKWCIFSCFNISECKTNRDTLLNNGAKEVIILNSANRYVKPLQYYVDFVLNSKPPIYKEFYDAGDVKVKREITREVISTALEDTIGELTSPSNGRILVCTHNYLYKVCGVFGMDPAYVFIDEAFNDYNRWYLNITGYELSSIDLKVRRALTELDGIKSANVIYLDATGSWSLESKYHRFFLGSAKTSIVKALADYGLVKFDASKPSERLILELESKGVYDLDPKDHKDAIVNINLVDNREMKSLTRSALRNYTHSGNLLANMIISHGEPSVGVDGKRRLLLACYKEVISILIKVIKDGDLQQYLKHKDEVKVLRDIGREDSESEWKIKVCDSKDKYIELKNEITDIYNKKFQTLKSDYKSKYGKHYKIPAYNTELHDIECKRQSDYSVIKSKYDNELIEISNKYKVDINDIIEFAIAMDDESYSVAVKTKYYCESGCRKMKSIDYDDIISRINARKVQLTSSSMNSKLLKYGDLLNEPEGIIASKSKLLLSRSEVAEITRWTDKKLDWLYSEFGRASLPIIPIKQFIIRNYEDYNKALDDISVSYHPELRMETRKIRYLNINGDKMSELYNYLAKFDEITLVSAGHGRGTNNWRDYSNVIQIGSYREANAPIECAVEDSWQYLNRGSMRCGNPQKATLWLDRDTIEYAIGPEHHMFNDWDTNISTGKSPSCIVGVLWSTDRGELVPYKKINKVFDDTKPTYNNTISKLIEDYPSIGVIYKLIVKEKYDNNPELLRLVDDSHLIPVTIKSDTKVDDIAKRINLMLKSSDYQGALIAMNELHKSGNWDAEKFYLARKSIFDLVNYEYKLKLYKSGKFSNRYLYFIKSAGHNLEEFLDINLDRTE